MLPEGASKYAGEDAHPHRLFVRIILLMHEPVPAHKIEKILCIRDEYMNGSVHACFSQSPDKQCKLSEVTIYMECCIHNTNLVVI